MRYLTAVIPQESKLALLILFRRNCPTHPRSPICRPTRAPAATQYERYTPRATARKSVAYYFLRLAWALILGPARIVGADFGRLSGVSDLCEEKYI